MRKSTDMAEMWKRMLQTGLEDDGWEWDWTTLGTLKLVKRQEQNVYAQIVAKAGGVWAASGLLQALELLSAEMGSRIEAKARVEDGARVKNGTVVCEWAGPARALLALERPFLNLACYVSGVATQTAKLVEIVHAEAIRQKLKNTPRVVPTRKTLPGYRDVAIHGVRVGGGHPHRVSLSGGVLIKENHIAAAGSIERAVTGARAVAPHGLKIEVEVRNLKELEQALAADAESVLLDNFTPAQVRAATKILLAKAPRVIVEVSGGLNESNIGEYVVPGVHVMSVGSLTLSVKALDLSLLVIQ